MLFVHHFVNRFGWLGIFWLVSHFVFWLPFTASVLVGTLVHYWRLSWDLWKFEFDCHLMDACPMENHATSIIIYNNSECRSVGKMENRLKLALGRELQHITFTSIFKISDGMWNSHKDLRIKITMLPFLFIVNSTQLPYSSRITWWKKL